MLNPQMQKNLFEIKLKSLLEWDNLMNPTFCAFMRSGRRILSSSSLHCKYHINFHNRHYFFDRIFVTLLLVGI